MVTIEGLHTDQQTGAERKEYLQNNRLPQPSEMIEAENALKTKRRTVHSYQLNEDTVKIIYSTNNMHILCSL